MKLALLVTICSFHFQHSVSKLVPCTDGKYGWFQLGDNCYSFIGSHRNSVTWAAAQWWCQYNNSNLLSIESDKESEYIISVLQRLDIKEPRWIASLTKGTSSNFKWSDGTPVKFENFKNPINLEPNETKCMAIENGKWLPITCDKPLGSYICKKYVGRNCLANWTKFERNCYRFYSDGDRDFDSAVKACVNSNANLASIHSEEEQAFIAETVREFRNNLWIGARRPLEGDAYEWVDKSPFNYTNWRQGEPSKTVHLGNEGNSKFAESCMEMKNVDGKWNDIPCHWKDLFICKMNLDTANGLRNELKLTVIHPTCFELLRSKVNENMHASLVYMEMASYFNTLEVSRKGFYTFFERKSKQERHHARKLVNYMIVRGGVVNNLKVQMPGDSKYTSGFDALKVALGLEQKVYDNLNEVFTLAKKTCNDTHLANFIEYEFLNEQLESISQIKRYIAILSVMDTGLGEFLFDKELYGDTIDFAARSISQHSG